MTHQDEKPNETPDEARIFQRLDRSEAYPYTLREYARRFAWTWVWRIFIRVSPPRAYRWRRFWLRRFGAAVHETASIRPRTRIMHPWLLAMGAHSMLADGVTIYNLGPVRIGAQTLVSQDVYVCAGTHDHAQPHLPLQRPGIDIGSGVWIAAQAFIGPGVTIGDNSVIGARAVVAKDVPAGAIAVGNPAAVKKQRTMADADSGERV